MARAKMTRHELKAQDEITEKIQSIIEAAYARRKQVIGVAAAVAVVVLAIIGWSLYSARRNSAAQAQLGAAIAAFNDVSITSEQERYQKAQAAAQAVIDQYGASSQAGLIATYYVGLSQAELGDTAGAAASLQRVIDDGDASVRGVARFALAGIYKEQGQNDQAIAILKELEGSGDYAASAVAYELGALHEAGSQAEAARDYYGKVIMEHSDSPFRPDAEAALRRLGFPVPTPVSTVTP